MDRCALFVDAGYLLADGAMAVHGTRNRDSVSWDYPGLVRLLNEIAHDRTGLPLLRCYWYEATVEGRRNTEQDNIADIPGVKVRAARIRPGRREGVESYVQRDITTLARSGVLCEAVLVSGDEDMVPVVADVQDLGVRVSVVQVEMDAEESTFARELRRECDDLIEVGANSLRPHVNLISGPVEAATEGVTLSPSPLTNGRSRANDTDVNRHPVAVHPGEARMKPVPAGGAMFGAADAQPPAEGNAMEQLRAMQQSIAQRRGGDHLAPQQTHPAMEANANDAMVGFPTGGQPSAAHTGGQPSAAQYAGTQPSLAQPGAQHSGAQHTGAHPAPAQPTGGYPAHHSTHPGTEHTAAQATGAQPSFAGHFPTNNGHQHPMNPATGANPSHAAPPTPDQQTVRLSPQAYPPTGPQPSHGHHPPAAPTPPDTPPPAHGPPGSEPHYRPNHDPRAGGGHSSNPTGGVSSHTDHGFASAESPATNPPATDPDPRPWPRHGPATNPTPQICYVADDSAPSPADAVEVARKEGSAFASAITKGAPALWIEAVLARRPAMPSDLEARMLQGSALPVDHLLRDEVRDALRDGFWRALERARQ